MITIKKIEVLNNHRIHFHFSDEMEKVVDFSPFIKDDVLTCVLKDDVLTCALKDDVYFGKVKVFDDGRGIYWPNGYDFCPDNLRYYIAEEETESRKHFEVHDKKAGQ